MRRGTPIAPWKVVRISGARHVTVTGDRSQWAGIKFPYLRSGHHRAWEMVYASVQYAMREDFWAELYLCKWSDVKTDETETKLS
jgi:hypothetical protein